MFNIHTELSKCLVYIELCAWARSLRDGIEKLRKGTGHTKKFPWTLCSEDMENDQGLLCAKVSEEFFIGFFIGNRSAGVASCEVMCPIPY